MFGAAKLIAGLMVVTGLAVALVAGGPAEGEWRAAGQAVVRAAAPDALRTAAPDALRTAAPDALRTAAPDALRTAAPDALRTAAPDALRTAAPGTGTPSGADYDGSRLGLSQNVALSSLGFVQTAFAQSRSAPKFLRIVVSGDGGVAFSGTGRPGTTVVLEKDGRMMTQVRVGANGRWSASMNKGLGAGDHVVSAYGTSEGDAQAGRLNMGQDVRISIPASFEGGSIVAYERDEPVDEPVDEPGDEPIDEPLVTTPADRDAAEELAAAANREFDRLSRTQPDLREGEAEEAGGQTEGETEVASGDGVIDFIEEAGRIYQRSVVDRLRTGGADPATASRTERQEQDLLEREAEAARQAALERERLERERLAAEARERAERERLAAQERRRAEEERREAQAERENQTADSQRAEEDRQAAEEDRQAAEREAEIARREAEAEELAAEARQRAREDAERRQRELAEQREEQRLAREREAAERREREEQEALLRQQLAERQALEEQRRREEAALEAEERRRAAELARQEREAEARRDELVRQKRLRAERVFELDDIGRRRLEALRQEEAEALARAEKDDSAERDEIAQRDQSRLPPAPQRGRDRRPVEGFDDPLGRDDFSASDSRERDGEILKSRPIDIEMAEERRAEGRRRDGIEASGPGTRSLRMRRGSIKDTGWPEDAAYPAGGRVWSEADGLRDRVSVGSDDEGTRVADWRLDPNSKCRAAAGQIAYRPRPVYTVAYGDTLWTISARFYGAGHRYRRIVDANRGKIRRGRLIFPCQELRLPGKLTARR